MFAVVVCAAAFPPNQRNTDEEPDNCAFPCPNIYIPICGTDGESNKIFTSQCVMERIACLEQKGQLDISDFWRGLHSNMTF